MNKTAIKNFAIWARVQLIESAKQKAYEYEITENGENKPVVDAVGGRLLTKEEKEQRRELIEQIRRQVGDEHVILGLSGGVDSSVCAALLARAIPGQVHCIFVDHGLMRKNEGDEVEAAFAGRELEFIRVNAQALFLEKLRGGKAPDPGSARDEILHTVACKAAIKAGYITDERELRRVAEAVLSGEVKYCPHGRPVSAKLTRRDLDKLFKRIV